MRHLDVGIRSGFWGEHAVCGRVVVSFLGQDHRCCRPQQLVIPASNHGRMRCSYHEKMHPNMNPLHAKIFRKKTCTDSWNPFSWKTRTNPFYIVSWHGCWRPDDARSQGISNNDIDITHCMPNCFWENIFVGFLCVCVCFLGFFVCLFPDIEMVHVVEVFPHGRQGRILHC